MFGPRQNPYSAYAAVVPFFIQKALLNEPITIHGDGNQTRDFVYVKDVVHANLHAMERANGTFNVALGNSISVVDLAMKILKWTNSTSELRFGEERSGDIKHSKAAVMKFKSNGFKPEWSLDKALKETISFYRSVLEPD